MPFCSHCGSQMDAGAVFCGKCGKSSAAAPPPPQQQPQAPPPPHQFAQQPAAPPYQAPPAKKGPNLLLWIGGGLAALVLLVIIGVVGVGFFVAKKAKDAGFDSALMQKNPVLGAARLALAMNPEVEVVNVNEDSGELTVREKKTGKVITMRAEDVKNGKITFTDESTGEQVSVGGEANLPDWVPDYPGSKPQGAVASTGAGQGGGMVHFKVADSPSQVLKFYQDEFNGAGYKITSPATSADGGMIIGEDEANRRTISATVSKSGSETQVALTYSTNK